MTTVSSRELLEFRKPFEDLEASVLERHLAHPGEASEPLVSGLRYVINFAKLIAVRDEEGRDHQVNVFPGGDAEWSINILRIALFGR